MIGCFEVIDVLLDAPQFYCQTFLGKRRFREVGTRQRCELKRRYDTSIKLNRLKCRPDVLLTYIHIAGVYWNTLINDVCFFCFVGLAGYHWNHGRFMLCFIPTARRDSSWGWPPDRYSTSCFGCFRGGSGVRLRQDGDEDFPEKMSWPKVTLLGW